MGKVLAIEIHGKEKMKNWADEGCIWMEDESLTLLPKGESRSVYPRNQRRQLSFTAGHWTLFQKASSIPNDRYKVGVSIF